MAFAKKHGFDEGPEQESEATSQRQRVTPSQSSGSANFGTQRFGKGSCDSEESCKKYCQEHPDECPGFKGYTRAIEGSESAQVSGKNYVGPSGCRNEAECKSWCETYPDKCPGFSEAKTRQESTRRNHELHKYEIERESEMQKRQYQNYQPSQYNSSPDLQQYLPSSGSYTPPPTTSSEGSEGSALPAAP